VATEKGSEAIQLAGTLHPVF